MQIERQNCCLFFAIRNCDWHQKTSQISFQEVSLSKALFVDLVNILMPPNLPGDFQILVIVYWDNLAHVMAAGQHANIGQDRCHLKVGPDKTRQNRLLLFRVWIKVKVPILYGDQTFDQKQLYRFEFFDNTFEFSLYQFCGSLGITMSTHFDINLPKLGHNLMAHGPSCAQLRCFSSLDMEPDLLCYCTFSCSAT